MQRFIGKKIHRKIVRPMSTKAIPRKVTPDMAVSLTEVELNVLADKPILKNTKTKEKAKAETQKKPTADVKEVENKEIKIEEKMDEKAMKVDNILNGEKLPKKKVKIEKKDKGLYERTEDSVTLLTEDNKMLLND